MNSPKSFPLAFALLALFAFYSGCSSTPTDYDPNSVEGMYKYAGELESDERYEEAVNKFNELKNKFPYSHFATDSELRIADIHFKKEAYIEAQTAYQLFKDFHPKHARSDYVTYRLAMSYFNQLPSTIDRDLSPAFKAIQYFREVMASYSTSQYVPDSKDKKQECESRLAQKELYIGNFYYIREKYSSALKRFENVLSLYPDRGLDDEARFKAGVSAFESGNPVLGKKHLQQLISQFPNSSYADKGKDALEKYGRR